MHRDSSLEAFLFFLLLSPLRQFISTPHWMAPEVIQESLYDGKVRKAVLYTGTRCFSTGEVFLGYGEEYIVPCVQYCTQALN